MIMPTQIAYTKASDTSVDTPIPLGCMEVWGGCDGINNRLCVTGLDVHAWSQPADQISGGDLYFVSMCACAEVSRFLVADVAGHDSDTAQVAKRLRKLMRRHINKPDQTNLASVLNREFDGMAQHGKFATAVLATFFPPSGELILCNAGHPRPLWYQSSTEAWRFLDPDADDAKEPMSNLPLGILQNTPYRQFSVKLLAGDIILMYTDGLTESRDTEGKMLGESGLLEVVESISIEHPDFLKCFHQAFTDVTDGNTSADDATIMLLRANGGQSPEQSFIDKIKVTAKILGLLPT